MTLAIRLKKKTDGSAALSCTRADGSVTWQRQTGAQGRFFPIHDLTHFAVETELGCREAFYGLVAGGWDITDFESGAQGPLPPQAGHVELVVGFLDTDRASGTRSTAAEFNAHAASFVATRGGTPVPPLTEDQLNRIRARLRDLVSRWHALPTGDTLELSFEPGTP